VGLRTQAVNRVHRELQILIPGGAKQGLSAARAKAMLASVRPRDEVSKLRKALVADQIADLVAIDKRLDDIKKQINAAVKAAPTTLPELRGVGPVITAIVVGEVRDVARFVDEDHFAAYNGTAPTTWCSAGDARPCVNRGGNRVLNHAIHMAAVTQIRYPRSPGRAYFDKKRAEGKNGKEALRALNARSATPSTPASWPTPGAPPSGTREGNRGTTLTPGRPARTPDAGTSDQPLPGLPPTLRPHPEIPIPLPSRTAAIPGERETGSRTGRSPAAQRRPQGRPRRGRPRADNARGGKGSTPERLSPKQRGVRSGCLLLPVVQGERGGVIAGERG